MYLQQKMPLFRWLPKWLDRWLDQPWLIDWAAGRSVKIEPERGRRSHAVDPPRPRGLSAKGSRAARRVARRRPAARRHRLQQHPHRRLRARDQAANERARRRHAPGGRHFPPRPARAAPHRRPWPKSASSSARSTASSPIRGSMPTTCPSTWAFPASGSRSCRWGSIRGTSRPAAVTHPQSAIRNPQFPPSATSPASTRPRDCTCWPRRSSRLRQMPGMEAARLQDRRLAGPAASGLCRRNLRQAALGRAGRGV